VCVRVEWYEFERVSVCVWVCVCASMCVRRTLVSVCMCSSSCVSVYGCVVVLVCM